MIINIKILAFLDSFGVSTVVIAAVAVTVVVGTATILCHLHCAATVCAC